MAAIATTTSQGSGQRTAVETNLTASDTFAYTYGLGQLLILINPAGSGGGTITPTIVGDTVWNFTAAETGTGMSALSGQAVPVLLGEIVVINLDEVYRLLSPTNTITGGTGLSAILTL